MTPPHLYHFRISHYNEKVRWALDWKGIAHRRTTLVPGLHHPVARALSGQNKLPIVDFDGTIVFDSSRLLEEIERRYPEPPLFPESAAERERARATGSQAISIGSKPRSVRAASSWATASASPISAPRA